MRIAIISDIHGNLEAFNAVLSDMDQQGVERSISLGDNIGYGADSDAVIQEMISRSIPSILGNHELACINTKVYRWYVGDVKRSLDDTLAKLSPSSMDYLRGMTINLSMFNAFFVHGFYPDSVRHYLHQTPDSKLLEVFKKMPESLCFLGHTHRLNLVFPVGNEIRRESLNPGTFRLEKNKPYMINAGSVGQPRDGDLRARYLIWDTLIHCLIIRYLAYDHHAAAEKIVAAGLPLKYARAVYPDIKR